MPPSRRATKACARCRKRKAKCDVQFPQCGNCALAGAACTGYDQETGATLPRSAVAELKDRIQQLESRLDGLRSAHAPSDIFGIGEGLDDLYSSLVDADPELHAGVKWSETRSHSHGSSRDFSFYETLLLSPEPFLPIKSGPLTLKPLEEMDPAEKRGRPMKSVPEDVVGILLKNYKDTYLAQYPFLDENELDKSFSRITNPPNATDVEASHYDHFSLGMALAISATTLTRLDGQRATTLGREFWNGAKLHLPFVFDGPGHEVLRAMLLLAHYGFLHPHACDPFTCSGAAMSLALEMGLQHEAVIDRRGKFLSQKERDDRRILFWSTYIMNCNAHYIPARPFNLPVTEVSTQIPYISATGMLNSFLSRSSYVAPHVWSARMLELETLTMMYSPGSTELPYEDFYTWQHGLITRLDEWHNATHSSVDNVLATTIQFHEIIYHFLIFRLNRPSPSYPVPGLSMRQQSVRAAFKLVEIYATLNSSGMLLYYWHAGYHMFELGVFLLQFMLGAIKTFSPTGFVQAEDIEPELLRSTFATIVDILWKVVSRWPETETGVRMLEGVSRPIVQAVEHWSQHREWQQDLIDPAVQTLLTNLTGIWSLPTQQVFRNTSDMMHASHITTTVMSGSYHTESFNCQNANDTYFRTLMG